VELTSAVPFCVYARAKISFANLFVSLSSSQRTGRFRSVSLTHDDDDASSPPTIDADRTEPNRTETKKKPPRKQS